MVEGRVYGAGKACSSLCIFLNSTLFVCAMRSHVKHLPASGRSGSINLPCVPIDSTVNRKEPIQIMKNALIIKQDNKCAHCEEILTDTSEVDHIKRVADGGSNEIENLQYLCKMCHRDKTESEEPLNELPDSRKWASSMSGALCEGYLCCDKPQNLIFGNGGECEHAIDNVRSRKN